MNKNKTEPYIFILILVCRIIMAVYGAYFIGIIVFNHFLEETSGKITSVHNYERTYQKKGVQKINVKDIYYQYEIEGKNYTGKRISNLLIFPDLYLHLGKNITVYYSPIFPGYSVVFKGNLEYYMYNILPIIILGIIVCIIKRKNNLHENTIKNGNTIKSKKNDIPLNEIYETVEDYHDETVEMEDKFIEEIRNGETAIKFILLLDGQNGIIIESLLKSEQIPYKIEYSSYLHNYADSIFYVLEKDYDDALYVITEYTRNKTKDEKEKIFIYKRK